LIEAVKLLMKESFNLIFIDFRLNGITGDQILDKLNKKFPAIDLATKLGLM